MNQKCVSNSESDSRRLLFVLSVSMAKLKLVLVGPSQAGKSTIANFLSDAIDNTNYEYRPTKGVRILEFELTKQNTEIELWDCAGDDKFENLWPAYLWKANGVIIVFNPENSRHSFELDRLMDHFIVKSMIPHTNALLVANCKDPDRRPSSPELSGTLAALSHISINVVENGDLLRSAFEKFISSIIDSKTFVNDDLGFLTSPL